MLNLIQMEISRMFKTLSFYVTIALCVIFAGGLLYILTPSMNKVFSSQTSSTEVSQQTENGFSVSMELDNTSVACPSNVCSSFIALGSIFIVIFAACFIGNFYKNGFCKNVIGRVKHRYYFQAVKAVSVMIYAAILIAVTAVATLVVANIFIDNFEFTYMKDFALYLLGEYCLLSVIGLASTFFTELCGSKVPAIVYIVLTSTNIMSNLVTAANSKLSEWFSTEIAVDDYLPSLYQLKFQTDVPGKISDGNNAVTHALVLSLAAFTLYNIIGSMVISKRDIK